MEVETEASQRKLFIINTGKATSDEIRESLLKIPENGQARHQDFLDSCISDPNKFEEKITKAKLKTFSDDCAKNRRKENKRIAELQGTRDLMGHLVVLATKWNLGLPIIFVNVQYRWNHGKNRKKKCSLQVIRIRDKRCRRRS